MMPLPPRSNLTLPRSIAPIPRRGATSGVFRGWSYVFSCALLLGGCATAPLQEPVNQGAPVVGAEPGASGAPTVEPIEVKKVEPPTLVLIEENNIYFDSGSTDVSARGNAKLQAHVERLKNDPDSYVTLVGHTDDLGSRNYNLALAEQRIESVSKLLRRHGVLRKQIRRYRGDGERAPNTCISAICRQKARRVEIVLPSALPE